MTKDKHKLSKEKKGFISSVHWFELQRYADKNKKARMKQ
jgi:hypothetical protein